MEKYIYKCFDCGKKFGADEIEKNLLYLCPDCGDLKKNRPLRGVLTIEYDYNLIRKSHSREEFLAIQPGRFWQYGYLWPLEFNGGKINLADDNLLDRISLDRSPLKELHYEGVPFLILDDTRNPTLSFKDRASSLVALKAMQLGIKEIAAASTGNAGSSLAGICARLGLKSIVFVPENIPEQKRIQIQSYGADIHLVKGDYDMAFDICLEISAQKKWYSRNTAYNPLTIEGKKSAAYDIFISLKGKMPGSIFVPTGDGVIISGLYKGFLELKELGWIDKLPKLIAVQAEGSNAVARYLANREFVYKPALSIADSICAGAPRCLYMAYEAVIKSGGCAIEVSDDEIIGAQEFIARNYGILCEPSASSAFAAYKKTFPLKDESALLLFTGNGLKDVSALKLWNKNTQPAAGGELKRFFSVK